MGIHRASIYATFGSKRGLFVSALRYYIKFYGPRASGSSGTDAAGSAAIMGVVEGATNNGGFIIRAAVEMAARDDEIGRIMAEVVKTWRCSSRYVPTPAPSRGDMPMCLFSSRSPQPPHARSRDRAGRPNLRR